MSEITLEDISLELPVYDSSRSFRTSFLKPLLLGGRLHKSDRSHVSVKALDTINLQLKGGDRLGLIGGNGAGKSSLLRLLAGIYEPTSGKLKLKGKVSSLFNLGFGMDGNSNGHENIEFIGRLRGLSTRQIREKTESIQDFSELGDYLNFPMRTYSLGMQSRLAFSIITAIAPDILLLDETFGVGDAHFIHKAQTRVQTMIGEHGILLFATHSEELLTKICNKLLWLHQGRIRMLGPLEEVLDSYRRHNGHGPETNHP